MRGEKEIGEEMEMGKEEEEGREAKKRKVCCSVLCKP